MLSTTAEYALRIMIFLTESEGESAISDSIAEATKVSPDYAVKVLQLLGRAKLVRGQRGRRGGFRLACDPDVTTLLDVVDAIDPLERITTCPLGRESHRRRLCPLHSRLDEVIQLLQDSLREMTLQSVVDDAPGPTLCRKPTVRLTASAKSGSRRGAKRRTKKKTTPARAKQRKRVRRT